MTIARIVGAVVLFGLGIDGTAAAAGVRHVVVVDLMTAPAKAVFDQGYGPVASGEILAKRDRAFTMPPGPTAVTVSSSVCSSAHRLALPSQDTIRVVVNPGCHLSIQ